MSIRLTISAVFLFLLSSCAFFGNETAANPTCELEYNKYVFDYWSIMKWMVEVKADLDGGFLVCSKVYPKEFGQITKQHEFWTNHTDVEMKNANSTLDDLIDSPPPERISKECLRDPIAKQKIKDKVHKVLNDQYDRVMDNEKRATAQDYLKIRINKVPDFSKDDTCRFMANTYQKYASEYEDNPMYRHYLFASSVGQSAIVISPNWNKKRSIEEFAKALKIDFEEFKNSMKESSKSH